jgi:hypothetical protein
MAVSSIQNPQSQANQAPQITQQQHRNTQAQSTGQTQNPTQTNAVQHSQQPQQTQTTQAPKPVVNGQGQTTGQLLNTTA